jgi:succinyl-CoA synthetase alpha subunit
MAAWSFREEVMSGVIVRENGQGRYQQEVIAGQHGLVADEPLSVGGEDAGPAPMDFVMAGLGACTSMTLRMYAERRGMALKAISVSLTHDKVSVDGAPRDRILHVWNSTTSPRFLNPSRSPSSALPTAKTRSATSSSRTSSIPATRAASTPINPKHETVQGQPAYKSIEEIGARVEMAVIATRPQTVPRSSNSAGAAASRTSSSSPPAFRGRPLGAALERKMMEIARSYGVRLLGPNCLGIIRPNSASTPPSPSQRQRRQSGAGLAIRRHVLGRARLGQEQPGRLLQRHLAGHGTADIDFGEILDYLIYDNRTHYILLYVEGIRDARRFMSALRSAARIKPIILLKAGRHAGGLRPSSRTRAWPPVPTSFSTPPCAAPASSACKNIGQLFYAAKALASKFRPQGNRLAIITNGGGRAPWPPTAPATSAFRSPSCRPRRWQALNARPADLVAQQPGRHRRRRHAGALPRRHPRRRRGPGRRRRPGHALAAGDDEPMEVAKAVIEVDRKTAETDHLPAGWARSRSPRRASCSRNRRHPGLPHAGNGGRAVPPHLDLLPQPEAAAADAGAAVASMAAPKPKAPRC